MIVDVFGDLCFKELAPRTLDKEAAVLSYTASNITWGTSFATNVRKPCRHGEIFILGSEELEPIQKWAHLINRYTHTHTTLGEKTWLDFSAEVIYTPSSLHGLRRAGRYGCRILVSLLFFNSTTRIRQINPEYTLIPQKEYYTEESSHKISRQRGGRGGRDLPPKPSSSQYSRFSRGNAASEPMAPSLRVECGML